RRVLFRSQAPLMPCTVLAARSRPVRMACSKLSGERELISITLATDMAISCRGTGAKCAPGKRASKETGIVGVSVRGADLQSAHRKAADQRSATRLRRGIVVLVFFVLAQVHVRHDAGDRRGRGFGDGFHHLVPGLTVVACRQ